MMYFAKIHCFKRGLIIILSGYFLSACVSTSNICGPEALPHSPLVIFGDSYSDTGNIAVDNIIEFPPPFHDGRFSDGLVAVDYLASHLDASAVPSKHTVGCNDSGYNYAVGGGNILGSKQGDLMCQLNSYLDRVADSADPDAWYLVIMGGNDVRSLRTNLSDAEANNQIDEIVGHLFTELERLVSAGARRIMVANLGDMGKLPGSQDDNPSRLTVYSESYNNKFNSLFGEFGPANPLVDVRKFDLTEVMKNITHTPSTLGFINTVDGCLVKGEHVISFHADCLTADIDPTTCTNIEFEDEGNLLRLASCVASAKFDGFVFFDSVHATAGAHKLIGQALIDILP